MNADAVTQEPHCSSGSHSASEPHNLTQPIPQFWIPREALLYLAGNFLDVIEISIEYDPIDFHGVGMVV